MKITNACIIFLLLLVSCDARKDTIRDERSDSIVIDDHSAKTYVITLDSIMRNIHSISVELDTFPILDDSTSEFKAECLRWILKKEDIIEIINLSKIITGSEMHDWYYDLPCRHYGRLIINNVNYNMIINAGSFMYLYNSNERIYLGCADEMCKKYFVVQGGDPKRDIDE